jgi:Fe-S-cluster containining protein
MVSCENCNGACCKWIAVPFLAGINRSAQEWAKARGGRVVGGQIWLPHKCPMLTDNKCGIYLSRPMWCKLWKVGGEGCLMCRKLEGF